MGSAAGPLTRTHCQWQLARRPRAGPRPPAAAASRTIVRAFVDYASSINTSASQSLGGVSGSSSSSASPSGFQRLRFGLNGRFFDHFWLGGMVVVRGQGSGVLTDAASNRIIGEIDTLTSYLATFGVAL